MRLTYRFVYGKNVSQSPKQENKKSVVLSVEPPVQQRSTQFNPEILVSDPRPLPVDMPQSKLILGDYIRSVKSPAPPIPGFLTRNPFQSCPMRCGTWTAVMNTNLLPCILRDCIYLVPYRNVARKLIVKLYSLYKPVDS